MQETDIKLLDEKLPNLPAVVQSEIVAIEEFRGDLTLTVKPEKIRDVIHHLKQDPALSFDVLMDLFAMDYSKFEKAQPERYCVIYHLVSMFQKYRVRLKVFLNEEKAEVDSIHDIYQAANWFEREAWDLFGIKFTNHPDLHRILCHQDFVGHPLRKDYPSDHYQRLKTSTTGTGI